MTRTVCRKPGCPGAVEDGYCNLCGLSAVAPRMAEPVAVNGAPGSGAITSTGSTPVSRGTFGTRSSRRTASRSTRKELGAGLLTLPDLPSREPESAVLPDAKVPENKRFCGHCERQLTRERGFCGQCGRKYSFVPLLQPGQLVADQYEVKGALAYGGLGWIHLAFDRLLSRYVVLKGLLNTEDSAAAAVALAERQFLASVRHPNIVGIYNFVQMDAEGYIVMEYVGGQTLRDIRRNRGPLPVSEAIAYIHRILGAFAYLHRQGLVYCDFKPENVMLECDDIKLIDLGGVRRIGDPKGDIYGTAGYSAPEANEGPTVASDLFTIGRTLAVLLTEIRGFGNTHRYTLPGAQDEPLFARQESVYRFLLKATAKHPADRFESAEAMADQLLGVFREVVAVETGIPRPASSGLFTGDMLPLSRQQRLDPVTPSYRHLPLPLPDAADPASAAVIEACSLLRADSRATALQNILQQTPASTEARLRYAAALIDLSRDAEASAILNELGAADPWDWRVPWMRGRMLIASGNPGEAQALFDQIYFDLPGELAPKLAFAMAAEQAGKLALATAMYDLVSRTDPGFTSACFGLARCLSDSGDRRGSVAALNRIPPESSLHICARVEGARAMIANGRVSPTLEDLVNAAGTLETLAVEPAERDRLCAQVFSVALRALQTKAAKPSASVCILGCLFQETPIRAGLERSLRSLAQHSAPEERIRLVDEANRVRPRTLL